MWRKVLGFLAVACLWLGVLPSTAVQARPARTGLLIVDHGEPPVYNEATYESFRAFFEHLIEMGLIPSWLKLIDNGTVVQDTACYACAQPSLEPHLMDAWLDAHEGPATYVPGSDNSPAHYVIPGGPGLGEPDIFEHVGLQAWHEWELMGGVSPNFAQKLPKKRAVIERLRSDHPDLPVRVGYGIDPHLGGDSQSIRRAVLALVNRDRVDRVVVAYHGVGFSDIMQTHMIRHEIEEILTEIGADVEVTYADPIGKSDRYIDAVVAEAKRELADLPNDVSVAIHLSGHGLSTDMCGDYDCGADSYHEHSAHLFRRTKDAIEKALDRPGRTGVFHIYGDGGEGDSDPDDEVDGPLEALAKRKDAGFEYVVDIPYEFDSDSRDTLIILRQGYERPIPDWDQNFESRFRWAGLRVKISNSSFGSAKKTDAFEQVIHAALEAARGNSGSAHGH
ncbi:MAG: hypothetical protein ACRDLB_03985 [Actinomycetota bacterium]